MLLYRYAWVQARLEMDALFSIPRGEDDGPRLVQNKTSTSPDISVGTASCMENTRNHAGAKSSRVIVEFAACRVQRSTSDDDTRTKKHMNHRHKRTGMHEEKYP